MRVCWNTSKGLMIVLFVMLTACGHKAPAQSEVCSQYPSAYMIQYPDGLKKSNVSVCDGYYKATTVDSAETIQATELTVQLRDQAGMPYLTTFSGQ